MFFWAQALDKCRMELTTTATTTTKKEEEINRTNLPQQENFWEGKKAALKTLAVFVIRASSAN